MIMCTNELMTPGKEKTFLNSLLNICSFNSLKALYEGAKYSKILLYKWFSVKITVEAEYKARAKGDGLEFDLDGS